MNIEVYPVTQLDLMKAAFDSTVHFNTKLSETDAYRMEHSPIRTRMYLVKMIGIPSFASTHFVRHKLGVEHFVSTNRDDRKGSVIDADRNTPVTHTMLLNAQALINMAKVRLCGKSHNRTRLIMARIKKELEQNGDPLADFLVPTCVYRNGICPEGRNTCGNMKRNLEGHYAYYKELF